MPLRRIGRGQRQLVQTRVSVRSARRGGDGHVGVHRDHALVQPGRLAFSRQLLLGGFCGLQQEAAGGRVQLRNAPGQLAGEHPEHAVGDGCPGAALHHDADQQRLGTGPSAADPAAARVVPVRRAGPRLRQLVQPEVPVGPAQLRVGQVEREPSGELPPAAGVQVGGHLEGDVGGQGHHRGHQGVRAAQHQQQLEEPCMRGHQQLCGRLQQQLEEVLHQQVLQVQRLSLGPGCEQAAHRQQVSSQQLHRPRAGAVLVDEGLEEGQRVAVEGVGQVSVQRGGPGQQQAGLGGGVLVEQAQAGGQPGQERRLGTRRVMGLGQGRRCGGALAQCSHHLLGHVWAVVEGHHPGGLGLQGLSGGAAGPGLQVLCRAVRHQERGAHGPRGPHHLEGQGHRLEEAVLGHAGGQPARVHRRIAACRGGGVRGEGRRVEDHVGPAHSEGTGLLGPAGLLGLLALHPGEERLQGSEQLFALRVVFGGLGERPHDPLHGGGQQEEGLHGSGGRRRQARHLQGGRHRAQQGRQQRDEAAQAEAAAAHQASYCAEQKTRAQNLTRFQCCEQMRAQLLIHQPLTESFSDSASRGFHCHLRPLSSLCIVAAFCRLGYLCFLLELFPLCIAFVAMHESHQHGHHGYLHRQRREALHEHLGDLRWVLVQVAHSHEQRRDVDGTACEGVRLHILLGQIAVVNQCCYDLFSESH
mmetsp:Transcript_10642/g.14652  ORF Transcript_10642/g.14652 Transcript_10642/m.14652 type:complete len:695 (-) Transcript_10642:400-2484(-)